MAGGSTVTWRVVRQTVLELRWFVDGTRGVPASEWASGAGLAWWGVRVLAALALSRHRLAL
jgi:hypothetical protein